jgi:plastocyanin
MSKATFSIIISAPILLTLACGGSSSGGGGGGGTPAPTGPSPTQTPTGTTVNIVSSSGSGAFNPNPVQVPSGGSITWRNSTGDSHALVMNDGRPIATIAPNASATTTLSGSGGNFRCTNHPSMVGSINGTAPPQGPAPGDDGY